MSTYFFPVIVRAKKYETREDNSYYVYSHYREQIISECQQRCVYCDAMLNEIGHEGFNLDHFRPQEIFPELANTPGNLVVSCSKCNRWKSSHWPMDKNIDDTHDGVVGFIDPFEKNRQEYFEVKSTGEVTPLQGPSEYIIRLLHLNRPSRILIRRNRLLSCKIDDLLQLAENTLESAANMLQQGQTTPNVIEMINQAKSAIAQIQLIRSSLSTI